MKDIAGNNYYSIKADEGKNRLYITLNGYWEDITKVPMYVNDVEKGAKSLSRGFSILSDLTTFKTPGSEVTALLEKGLKIAGPLGLSKLATVLPESAIVKMSMNREKLSERADMKNNQSFASKAEAEAWLNS
jgi:hypothetical protein